MSTLTNAQNSDEEPDDYLIELIGLKEDFPDDAKRAYGKLYERYWDKALKIAERICFGRRENGMTAEDLVAETFKAIYFDKAKSFRKQDYSRKSIEISITAWIHKIMRCVHYDLFIDTQAKERKKEESILPPELQEKYIIDKVAIVKFMDESHEDLIRELDESSEKQPDGDNDITASKNIELVYDYLQKLPEREADIIRTSYQFYQEGKKTPTNVLDYFEVRWGTKRDNVRRIMKKFRDTITEKLQDKLEYRR